jgi:hypothetical protein
MAIPLDAFVGEDESIGRIDDNDDLEKITSFDFSSYSFDVGKTCLGLHEPGAVDYGTGS